MCSARVLPRCRGPRFGRAQIRHESDESGTATVAGQDSPWFLTEFPLIIHQVFRPGRRLRLSGYNFLLRHCLQCHMRLTVRPGRRERRRIEEYTKPISTRSKLIERTDLYKNITRYFSAAYKIVRI